MRQHGQNRLAIAFVILYAIFFPLTFAPYVRILYTTQYNAGIVPWTDARKRQEEERLEREKLQEKSRSWRSMCGPVAGDDDIEVGSWIPPDQHPDSPGLERFYSKNIFVCESDGRPKWCSECRAWKPDRASHSSELGHCVRKMDHLCPWVGGMVSETCEHIGLAAGRCANSIPISLQFLRAVYSLCFRLLRHMLSSHGLLSSSTTKGWQGAEWCCGRRACAIIAFRLLHVWHGSDLRSLRVYKHYQH